MCDSDKRHSCVYSVTFSTYKPPTAVTAPAVVAGPLLCAEIPSFLSVAEHDFSRIDPENKAQNSVRGLILNP